MAIEFVTDRGRSIKLGDLLGKGGEANVYNVDGDHDVVAKVYHSAPTKDKQEKLAWMTRLSTPDLSKFAAWPVATIQRRGQGTTAGVLMPRVENAREIHELYGPAHRRTEFPTADWHFLIRAARNCAAAFSTLHAKSIIVGDVNQGNLLVTRQAVIKMIDCDSFQLTASGRLFRCTVGVAHFQPPELQTARFDSIVRTPNHDNFGLAVVIFHLLFMGRHPFSVKPLDREDISIEDAIKSTRFPYGKRASTFRVAPPPHSLQLTNISSELAGYFESAFSSATTGGGRPTASQWASALASFESKLTKCSDDAGHVYFGPINACPWCTFEHNGGPDFFVSVSVARTSTAFQTFDLEQAWSKIAFVQAPKNRFCEANRLSTANIPTFEIPPQFINEVKFQQLLKKISTAGAFASLFGLIYGPILIVTAPLAILFGIAYLTISNCSNFKEYKLQKQKISSEKRHAVSRLTAMLKTVRNRGQAEFETKFGQLELAYIQYKSLADRYTKAKAALNADASNRQRDEWLDRYYISQAVLSGIGPGRVATLQSYGIETARDISREHVSRIPGFGPVLTSTLVAWRGVCESSFHFDPLRGIPATDIQQLERTLAIERTGLMRTLQNGASTLEQIAARTNSVVSRLDAELVKAEYELAKADKEVASCS